MASQTTGEYEIADVSTEQLKEQFYMSDTFNPQSTLDEIKTYITEGVSHFEFLNDNTAGAHSASMKAIQSGSRADHTDATNAHRSISKFYASKLEDPSVKETARGALKQIMSHHQKMADFHANAASSIKEEVQVAEATLPVPPKPTTSPGAEAANAAEKPSVDSVQAAVNEVKPTSLPVPDASAKNENPAAEVPQAPAPTTEQAHLPKPNKPELIGKVYEKLAGMTQESLEKLHQELEKSLPQQAPLNKVHESTDLAKLMEEAGLKGEFAEKAQKIFEEAVEAKAKTIVESNEPVIQVPEKLVEQVDQYLTGAVLEWIEKNQVAIDQGLRVQIAEDFLGKLGTFLSESYVSLDPKNLTEEVQKDVENYKAIATKNAEIKTQLQEQVNQLQREKIILEACDGIALTDRERLKTLVEKVEFTSPEDFQKKVLEIRESFSSKKPIVKTPEVVTHLTEDDQKVDSPAMNAYANALSRLVKS